MTRQGHLLTDASAGPLDIFVRLTPKIMQTPAVLLLCISQTSLNTQLGEPLADYDLRVCKSTNREHVLVVARVTVGVNAKFAVSERRPE